MTRFEMEDVADSSPYPIGASFVISQYGGKTYADNLIGGKDVPPDADAAVVINAAIMALSTSNTNTLTNQIYIRFAPGIYTCNSQIVIPLLTAIELHLVGCGQLISRLVYTGNSDFMVTSGSPTNPLATLNLFVEDLGFIYQTGTNQKFIWKLLHVNTLVANKVLWATNDAIAGDQGGAFETMDFGNRPLNPQGVVAAYVSNNAGNEVTFQNCKVAGCAFGWDLSDSDISNVFNCEMGNIAIYGASPTAGNAYANTSVYSYGAGLFTRAEGEVRMFHVFYGNLGLLLKDGPQFQNPGPSVMANYDSLFFEACNHSIATDGAWYNIGIMRMLNTGPITTNGPVSFANFTSPYTLTSTTPGKAYIDRIIGPTSGATIFPAKMTSPFNPSVNPPVSNTIYQNNYMFDFVFYLPAYATTPGTDGTIDVKIAPTNSLSSGPSFTQIIPGTTTSLKPQITQLHIPQGWYFRVITSGVTLQGGTSAPS